MRALLVTIATTTWGVPLGVAREIADVGEPAPLPLSPPGLLGLVNLRGEVLPLLDVDRALGGAGTGATGRVLVVSAGGGLAALAVGAAQRIEMVSPGADLPLLDVDAAVLAATGG